MANNKEMTSQKEKANKKGCLNAAKQSLSQVSPFIHDTGSQFVKQTEEAETDSHGLASTQQQHQEAVDMKPARPGVFPILDLPAEVRLQLYKWVHLQHPIRTDGSGLRGSLAYVCKRVVAVGVGALEDSASLTAKAGGTLVDERGSNSSTPPPPPLLSPYRPWTVIPTALLQTCRQIHAEARALALEENEFDSARLSPTKRVALGLARPMGRARLHESPAAPAVAARRLALRAPRGHGVGHRPPRGRRGVGVGRVVRLWAAGLRGLRLKIQGGGGGIFGRSWIERRGGGSGGVENHHSNGDGGGYCGAGGEGPAACRAGRAAAAQGFTAVGGRAGVAIMGCGEEARLVQHARRGTRRR
ncbi:hypothetical protein PG994_009237 [Apiospora phragmitis]|uniref:Uncharacterized protein n=1 Tax=Apiospora phragmitis TaxID=2905665 RepID=A0ABR1ULQ0_9PEZI